VSLIETSVRDYILGDVAITDVIGEGTKARMWPLLRAQGSKMPAIVYSDGNVSPLVAQNNDPRLATANFTFACIAENYIDAKDLSERLRKRLHRFLGSLNSTFNYVMILVVNHGNDLALDPGDSSGELYVAVTLQATVQFRPPSTGA
jgi:hypothetical protein